MQPSPLDALHDVLAPTEVSWWPLSYAAWAVIAASLLVITFMIWWLYQRHQHNIAKREAQLLAKHEQDALALHALLKRLVKHYYGTELASVRQEVWIKIVARLCKQTFSTTELASLYSQAPQDDLVRKLRTAIGKFDTKARKLREVCDV